MFVGCKTKWGQVGPSHNAHCEMDLLTQSWVFMFTAFPYVANGGVPECKQPEPFASDHRLGPSSLSFKFMLGGRHSG
jgi:hypothetical protein